MHPNFVCLLFVGIQGTENTQHLDDFLTDGGCLLCLDFIQHDLKQFGISILKQENQTPYFAGE